MAVSKLKNISKSVSKQIIDKWAWFCISSKDKLQKKCYLRLLLIIYSIKSINVDYSRGFIFIVIIRVTILECFKMQMVINLAPVSLSNKKVNFYTCPRLTFLKRNTTENAYKRISEPLHFKIFLWGGGGHAPRPPYRLAPSALENCLVSFWSLATALQKRILIRLFWALR